MHKPKPISDVRVARNEVRDRGFVDPTTIDSRHERFATGRVGATAITCSHAVPIVRARTAAGCGSSSHAIDANVGEDAPRDAPVSIEQCEMLFEQAVDRTCTTAADCELVVHPLTDCCGSVEIGASIAGDSATRAAETKYEACWLPICGGRGCFSNTQAEDGRVPSPGQMFVAICSSGRCTSTVQ
jgi:hypothetical protein